MSQAEQDQRKSCVSCGITIVGTGYAQFNCPECGHEIYRCSNCRKQGNKYKCPDCGFVGP
ncbi:MAG: HVO_2753 family zinc finger protein [Halobacteria archaeon]|nr:HVO_2753 family zinc finger protein [Halobacteria archaeon]